MIPLKGISVVIPNYNGSSLLPQVIPLAQAAAENTGLSYEIIVVDDCSTDDSLAVLNNNFPAVRIIVNEKNAGFSVTANKGITATQYDWVLLLNSDVKLEPDYFSSLLKYTSYPRLFAVMGRIEGWHDTIIQDGAKYPYFHGMKIKTSGNYLFENEAHMKDGLYSMYVSGANAFINKKVFLGIGGFNELFSPFYIEDFELSLRAWRLGYTCYYDHQSVCRHKASTTIAGTHRKKQINTIYNRNKMYLHAIHLDQPKRFAWFLQVFIEAIGYAFLFRWNYIRSVKLFLSNYQLVKKSRQQIKEAAHNGRLLSVHDVVTRIEQFIGQQTIRRF